MLRRLVFFKVIQLTQGGTQFPVEEGSSGAYDLSRRIPVSQCRQLGTPWFHPLLNIFQVKSTFRPTVSLSDQLCAALSFS